MKCSVILPSRNEAEGLRRLLPDLVSLLPNAEIIVVNDGSDDDTLAVCAEFPIRVISHPYPKGNGAAVKSGARAANREVLIFMAKASTKEASTAPPQLPRPPMMHTARA